MAIKTIELNDAARAVFLKDFTSEEEQVKVVLSPLWSTMLTLHSTYKLYIGKAYIVEPSSGALLKETRITLCITDRLGFLVATMQSGESGQLRFGLTVSANSVYVGEHSYFSQPEDVNLKNPARFKEAVLNYIDKHGTTSIKSASTAISRVRDILVSCMERWFVAQHKISHERPEFKRNYSDMYGVREARYMEWSLLAADSGNFNHVPEEYRDVILKDLAKCKQDLAKYFKVVDEAKDFYGRDKWMIGLHNNSDRLIIGKVCGNDLQEYLTFMSSGLPRYTPRGELSYIKLLNQTDTAGFDVYKDFDSVPDDIRASVKASLAMLNIRRGTHDIDPLSHKNYRSTLSGAYHNSSTCSNWSGVSATAFSIGDTSHMWLIVEII
jgi:hypothetical protein